MEYELTNCVCKCEGAIETIQATLPENDLKRGLEIGLVILIVLLVIIGLIVGFNKLNKQDNDPDNKYY